MPFPYNHWRNILIYRVEKGPGMVLSNISRVVLFLLSWMWITFPNSFPAASLVVSLCLGSSFFLVFLDFCRPEYAPARGRVSSNGRKIRYVIEDNSALVHSLIPPAERLWQKGTGVLTGGSSRQQTFWWFFSLYYKVTWCLQDFPRTAVLIY
jgi:hypothetical protein